MYKNYIKRKIASLVSEKLKKDEFTYRTAFSRNKEMEIVVWLRLQEGSMDKPQMIDFMKNKFHVSDIDALRIFEKTFPDGLTLVEERALEKVDVILQETPGMKTDIIDDIIETFSTSSDPALLKQVSADPLTVDKVLVILKPILQSRHLV